MHIQIGCLVKKIQQFMDKSSHPPSWPNGVDLVKPTFHPKVLLMVVFEHIHFIYSPSQSPVFKTIHQGIAVSFTVHYGKVSQEQCKEMLLVWKHRAEWHKLALQGSAHTQQQGSLKIPYTVTVEIADSHMIPFYILFVYFVPTESMFCIKYVYFTYLWYIYFLIHIHVIIAQLLARLPRMGTSPTPHIS